MAEGFAKCFKKETVINAMRHKTKSLEECLQLYLKKIKDVQHDRCWFCGKNPDQIREEFYQAKNDPDKGFDQFEIEDIVMITYKTKRPICASCYFTIKKNPDLIKEILSKPQKDVW